MKSNKIDKELAFNILYNKSLGIIEEFRKKQNLDLAELLKQSEKEIKNNNTKSFSVDDFLDEITQEFESKKDERLNNHLAWLDRLSNIDKSKLSYDFIEYLWDNQDNQDDLIYYHYWLLVNRLLNIYQRFDNKKEELSKFQFKVVAQLLHQKTPYSQEGYLPVLQILAGNKYINIIPGDPVSDSWLVQIKDNSSKGEVKDFSLWESNIYCEEHITRLLSGLPDSFNDNKHAVLCIKDDYDLHGLIRTFLSC